MRRTSRSCVFCLLLAFQLSIVLPATALPASASGVTTIGVGGAPEGVAINPTTNTIYVANVGSNTLSVIDGATNAVTATIPIGANSNPTDVAVNPTTNTVYVAHGGDNMVSVINGATNAVTATIAIGPTTTPPSRLAVNATTNTLYVASSNKNVVVVISGATNAVTATIAVGANTTPADVAVNPTTNTVYVTSLDANTVMVINGATNTISTIIPIAAIPNNPPNPDGVAVNAMTNTVYTANRGSNTVSVINGVTNAVTAAIPVGLGAQDVAVEAATNTIYVANAGNNTVSAINGATNAVTASLSLGSGSENTMRLAINPQTHILYVINFNENTVSVIQTQVAPPQPKIRLAGPQGTDITNTTQNVLIGQPNVLFADYQVPSGTTVISQTWSVPGEIVGGYAASASSGSVAQAVLNNTLTAKFSWVRPGNAQQVMYSYALDNGQSASARVTFNVDGPSAGVTAFEPVLGFVAIRDFPFAIPPYQPGSNLSCGVNILPFPFNLATVCFRFNVPAATRVQWGTKASGRHQGTFQWVQIIMRNEIHGDTPPGSTTPFTCTTGPFPHLDTQYPYPSEIIVTADSPAWPLSLLGNSLSARAEFSAQMYLDWLSSSVPNAIPVPLGSVRWGWKGHAARHSTSADWTDGGVAQEGRTGQLVDLTGDPLVDYPTWTIGPVGAHCP